MECKLEEANKLKLETKEIKEKIKGLKADFSLLEEEIQQLLYQIPNVPNSTVPPGLKESENEVIYEDSIAKSDFVNFLPTLGAVQEARYN